MGTGTAIQRFGSGSNLHVHFHCLVIDGVFDEDAFGHVRFTQARPWTSEAIAEGLVPRPHASLLVHHGVLAAHARDRERLVVHGLPRGQTMPL